MTAYDWATNYTIYATLLRRVGASRTSMFVLSALEIA